MKLDKSCLIGTIKPPKSLELLDRIIYIEKEIKEIIKAKEAEFIAIEELSVTRNAKATKALTALLYHLLIEFRKREYLVVQVRPSSWRKACNIRGSNREQLKTSAIQHIHDLYMLIVNDDEADALCVAEFASKLEVENGNKYKKHINKRSF
ncbi:MAG: crossover junction endodeoxyribonuclease RuvC [Coprobacillus sp.]